MHRIVPSITTLAQHLRVIDQNPDPYRPTHCPHCQLGRMWYHGCYFRKADRNQLSGTPLNPVPVRRYFCPGCRRTCSRLPLCIAPRRWYDWSVQHRALYNLVCGHSVRSTSCNTGLARRTVRRWRDWLHDRNEAFSFFLRSRFPELGRTVDAAAFWRKVMEEMSLGLAMAWLDRALEIP